MHCPPTPPKPKESWEALFVPRMPLESSSLCKQALLEKPAAPSFQVNLTPDSESHLARNVLLGPWRSY